MRRALPTWASTAGHRWCCLWLALGLAALPMTMTAQPRMGDGEAGRLMMETVNLALQTVRNTDLELAKRRSALRVLAEKRFDVPAMARLALGSGTWQTLTPAQQQAYQKLFADDLFRAYSRNIETLGNETVELLRAHQFEDRASVLTLVMGHETKAQIEYKLYTREKDWLVYDVLVEGVSIIKTTRNQYEPLLKDGGIDGLMKALSEKLAKPD